MKSLLSAGLILAMSFLGGVPVTSSALADNTSPVVLELFTSQGCSSCPPADRILGKFATDQDVIALSFHVDYWDYIGWKDTFASKLTTARQHNYARALGERHVYTPQVIIQGQRHMVGSDEGRLRQAVRAARSLARTSTKATLQANGNKLILAVSGASAGPLEAWLFAVDRRHDVAVRRGENTGRKLTYSNVVREVHLLARWDGAERTFEIRADKVSPQPRDGYVILVQARDQGPVQAAASHWLN